MKFLSKILFFISSFNILPPPRDVQDHILKTVDSKFNHVDPLLMNSLKQYECHKSYYKNRFWALFNTVSFILIFPLIFLFLLRGLFGADKASEQIKRISLSKVDFEDLKALGIVQVNKVFGYIKPTDYMLVARVLFKSGMRPYFWLRSIWKIAMYSQLVDRHKPNEIWVNQEMVFESSLITYFLEKAGIEHVNFMHGDNFYSIQIAYSSFSKFYIWEDYYKAIFEMLRMQVGEYLVFDPMPVRKEIRENPTYKVFKYYAQNSVSAKEFESTLEKLITVSLKRGCKLVIRLHPLHKKKYEEDLIKRFNIEIEKNSEKNIIQSLQESNYVCSAFSTVLYQAHKLNKRVIIDNSDSKDFDLLKDLEPIYLKKYKSELLVD